MKRPAFAALVAVMLAGSAALRRVRHRSSIAVQGKRPVRRFTLIVFAPLH
jgi:hypothetical protein